MGRIVSSLTCIVICLLLSGEGFSAPSDEKIIKLHPYDCVPEDCEPAIQKAINTLHDSGGGTLKLSTGIFPITRPIIIKSNVKLVGSGIESTTVQPARDLVDKIIEGAGVWSSIAFVKAHNASAQDFTLDHRTNSTLDNGISILPAGRDFDGEPSSNITVSNTAIVAAPVTHNYMIWNLRGEDIIIRSNTIDGGSDASFVISNQEGIESYGGTHVVIADNQVANIGSACINVGSAGGRETGVKGVYIYKNRIDNCGVGIHLGSVFDKDFGEQTVNAAFIHANEITSARKFGISLIEAQRTRLSDINVYENNISGFGVGSEVGFGAGVYVKGGRYDEKSNMTELRLNNNLLGNGIGSNAIGVLVIDFSGASMVSNTLNSIDSSGVSLRGSKNIKLLSNSITKTGIYAVEIVADSDGVVVMNNIFEAWGFKVKTAAVLCHNSRNIDLAANTFGSLTIGEMQHLRLAEANCNEP